MIAFKNLMDGRRYRDGSVALIFQARGNLVYSKGNKKGNLEDLYEEPYETAYKIVMGTPFKPPEEI